jgi:hypothetical protein
MGYPQKSIQNQQALFKKTRFSWALKAWFYIVKRLG